MKKWFDDSADGSGGDDLSKKKNGDVSSPKSGGKPGNQMYIDKKKSLSFFSSRKNEKNSNGYGLSREDYADASSSETGDKSGKWMQIGKKKPWSIKKRIIVSCASALAAALLGLGIYGMILLIHPSSAITLDPISKQTPLPGESPQYSDGQLVTPSPTIDPYAALMDRSDFSILENTVNILLIGVDYAPERTDWDGKKAYHSDVMIVLAINKETGAVNLISLPRDTYAKIPGVKGIYKLNASIDCGGGWPSAANNYSTSGFDKVCEAASWMLGNIPVQYYYAVDMTAVKGLVDNMEGGGLDYDCDIDFSIQGRRYYKGLQHMDGQAVLDYLRVRKGADGSHEGIEDDGGKGDANRVIRQKNMLVAIFKTLKSSGQLYNVDTMIKAFNGSLYTNVPLDQTAAIAAYAANIDPANIGMISMSGSSKSIFNWNFIITDQKKRVETIRQVYGDAAIELYKIRQYGDMALPDASMLWEEMQMEVVLSASRPLLDQAKAVLDADKALPDYPVPEYTEPAPSDSTDPEASPAETPAPTPSPIPIPSEGYRKYPEGGDVWAAYNRAEAAYQQLSTWDFDDTSDQHIKDTQALKDQLKLDVQNLYSTLSLGSARTVDYWTRYVWHVIYGDTPSKLKSSDYNQSLVHNEIPVDFN